MEWYDQKRGEGFLSKGLQDVWHPAASKRSVAWRRLRLSLVSMLLAGGIAGCSGGAKQGAGGTTQTAATQTEAQTVTQTAGQSGTQVGGQTGAAGQNGVTPGAVAPGTTPGTVATGAVTTETVTTGNVPGAVGGTAPVTQAATTGQRRVHTVTFKVPITPINTDIVCHYGTAEATARCGGYWEKTVTANDGDRLWIVCTRPASARGSRLPTTIQIIVDDLVAKEISLVSDTVSCEIERLPYLAGAPTPTPSREELEQRIRDLEQRQAADEAARRNETAKPTPVDEPRLPAGNAQQHMAELPRGEAAPLSVNLR